MIEIDVAKNTLTIMHEQITCIGDFIPEKLGHLQVFINYNHIKVLPANEEKEESND